MAVKPKTAVAILAPDETIKGFSKSVLNWFDVHGRKHLPWQQDINAYRVWISEIMLQQTQVATVIPYFEKFMQSFPTVESLAAAKLDEVLHHWSGLGYYSRARNLHKSAQIIMARFNGEFPRSQDDIMELPGIGQSTSGAIVSIAYQQSAAILDGNVKRVLARVFAVEGWPGKSDVLKRLWSISEAHTPKLRANDYTQAMMDLGATLCTRSKPNCEHCPLIKKCKAFKQEAQSRYPGKKPRKVLPVKSTCMIVIRQGQKIFLAQRPSTGIWPGLWSFPEIAAFDASDATGNSPYDNKALKQFLNTTGLGKAKPQKTSLTGFRHTFSHYHLDIQILLLDVNKQPKLVMQAQHLWFNPKQPAAIGLAAPVTKILKQLNSRQQQELAV